MGKGRFLNQKLGKRMSRKFDLLKSQPGHGNPAHGGLKASKHNINSSNRILKTPLHDPKSPTSVVRQDSAAPILPENGVALEPQ